MGTLYKIKSLEWEDFSSNEESVRLVSKTNVGNYEVRKVATGEFIVEEKRVDFIKELGFFDNIEDGKSQASKRYKERLIQMLEPFEVPEGVEVMDKYD